MKAESGELVSMSGAPQFGAVSAKDTHAVVPSVAATPRCFDLSALPLQTRADQIATTLDRSVGDEMFCGHIALADAARDRGDWVTAELEYGYALRRYPKDKQLYVRAEIWYRSAVALGAPADMVDLHLAFVARLNGAVFVRNAMPVLDVAPMAAPPTVHDIRVLGALLRVPGLADEDLVLHLMRTAPDNRAVLLHMLDMPGFVQSNRAFLSILES